MSLKRFETLFICALAIVAVNFLVLWYIMPQSVPIVMGSCSWQREFELEAIAIKKIANGPVFLHPQPIFGILRRTGRGDCMAWSGLMMHIARKHGIDCTLYLVTNSKEFNKSWVRRSSHAITILKDNLGKMWLQSNETLLPVASIDHALRLLPHMVMGNWADCVMDNSPNTRFERMIIAASLIFN